MLVLSRRVGESIVVPSLGITITVVQVDGNRTRLGIQAPPEVAVHREEVQRRIEGRPSRRWLPCGQRERVES